MTAKKKAESFEDGLERLEQIATEMEKGELELEELLSLYEEGLKLNAQLKQKLTDAEDRMRLLTQNEQGKIILEDITEEMKSK